MLDTIKKMRALVSMKTTLIEAIRADLAQALAKIDVMQDVISQLNNRIRKLETENQQLRDQADPLWWQTLDKEMGRREAEERNDEVHIDVDVKEQAYEIHKDRLTRRRR